MYFTGIRRPRQNIYRPQCVSMHDNIVAVAFETILFLKSETGERVPPFLTFLSRRDTSAMTPIWNICFQVSKQMLFKL